MRLSAPGEVRIGPLRALPTVLREWGVEPQRAFARAGVDPGLFDDAESRMPFEALSRLLDICSKLSGCAHLGLLVGERFDLRAFGPLGQLMRNCPTLGDALHCLLHNLYLLDHAATVLLLKVETGRVLLGYSIYRHGSAAALQVLDAAIAVGYRLLAELGGRRWQPVRVQLAHGRPRSVEAFRAVFGPHLVFNAEVSGIVFDADWLGQGIAGADATLHAQLSQALRDAESASAVRFSDRVQSVLHQMLLGSEISTAAVAQHFGLHERGLRRRLAAEGESLQQLVGRTRFELARQLLRNTGLQVTQIGLALGYEDANAFSRAFHRWAQCSPTQWRAGA
ncbi:MAG: AraC family transcriptional regulator [Burkholderiaceae bacterium]|nr:AraC family transcriptional regulator [Burkholderiaceae bacterium]